MKNNLCILFLGLCSLLHANNISVSNVVLTGQSTAGGLNHVSNHTMVQFDLSWENSWRSAGAPNNWDAAWVFIKYRVGNGQWQHARLNDTGHSVGASASIDVGLQTLGSAFNSTGNPGVGAFIYRSAVGEGTFSISNVRLRWNYGANGVLDNDAVDVRVFAIEMVYVPQGNFSLGDATTTPANGNGSDIGSNFRNGSANVPFVISGESALTLGGVNNGNLTVQTNSVSWLSDDFNVSTEQTLPATFPKGYNAFYGMKYEISQQGYVDFLNTLTRVQQDSRTRTTLSLGVTGVTERYVMSGTTTIQRRNGIRCDAAFNGTAPIHFYCDLNGNGIGGETTDGQWLACNWLSVYDNAAYLFWSGLRPMTELEFEKACRGPLTPVIDEYAWGSTSFNQATAINNNGAFNETSSPGANIAMRNNENVQGPVRVGSFATATTTRAGAGAGYYGMMELSGNLWERTVTIGRPSGRAYTGLHGTGMLTADGNSDEPTWPGILGGLEIYVGGNSGMGNRGCDWFGQAQTYLTISNRSMANYGAPDRNYNTGGRGVRSAS